MLLYTDKSAYCIYTYMYILLASAVQCRQLPVIYATRTDVGWYRRCRAMLDCFSITIQWRCMSELDTD